MCTLLLNLRQWREKRRWGAHCLFRGTESVMVSHCLTSYIPGARDSLHAKNCHSYSRLIWIESHMGHHKNQDGRSDHWQKGRYSIINTGCQLSKWRPKFVMGKYNLTWNCQFLMEFDEWPLEWKIGVSALQWLVKHSDWSRLEVTRGQTTSRGAWLATGTSTCVKFIYPEPVHDSKMLGIDNSQYTCDTKPPICYRSFNTYILKMQINVWIMLV